LLRHIPIRWLSLEPAIERLIKCWTAVKIYFIGEGEEETNKLIWSFTGDQKDGLLENGELSVPECYIHFVFSFMKVFTDAIKQLESDKTFITQVFSVMDKVRNELSERKNDQFFGYAVNNNFKFLMDSQISSFKKQALNVYDRALAYLNKWFDFEASPLKKLHVLNLDETCLFSNMMEIASSLDLHVYGDALYKEYV
jgi:hypothetical protein